MDNVPEPIPDSTIQLEAEDLLNKLFEEAKKRLNDPKQIRKMSTGDILSHIEKIMMALKKNNVLLSKKTTVNLGVLHERAVQLDNHPANRQDEREKIRNAIRINRSATR